MARRKLKFVLFCERSLALFALELDLKYLSNKH